MEGFSQLLAEDKPSVSYAHHIKMNANEPWAIKDWTPESEDVHQVLINLESLNQCLRYRYWYMLMSYGIRIIFLGISAISD